jgi:hypothetical protein
MLKTYWTNGLYGTGRNDLNAVFGGVSFFDV